MGCRKGLREEREHVATSLRIGSGKKSEAIATSSMEEKEYGP